MTGAERRRQLLMQSQKERGGYRRGRYDTYLQSQSQQVGTFSVRLLIAVFIISCFWAMEKNDLSVFQNDSNKIVKSITSESSISIPRQFHFLEKISD